MYYLAVCKSNMPQLVYLSLVLFCQPPAGHSFASLQRTAAQRWHYKRCRQYSGGRCGWQSLSQRQLQRPNQEARNSGALALEAEKCSKCSRNANSKVVIGTLHEAGSQFLRHSYWVQQRLASTGPGGAFLHAQWAGSRDNRRFKVCGQAQNLSHPHTLSLFCPQAAGQLAHGAAALALPGAQQLSAKNHRQLMQLVALLAPASDASPRAAADSAALLAMLQQQSAALGKESQHMPVTLQTKVGRLRSWTWKELWAGIKGLGPGGLYLCLTSSRVCNSSGSHSPQASSGSRVPVAAGSHHNLN